MSDPQKCAWCGGPVKQPRGSAGHRRFCGVDCRTDFEFYGGRASRAVILARLAHADRQPRGAQSVAEYFQRGGTVYRGP